MSTLTKLIQEKQAALKLLKETTYSYRDQTIMDQWTVAEAEIVGLQLQLASSMVRVECEVPRLLKKPVESVTAKKTPPKRVIAHPPQKT